MVHEFDIVPHVGIGPVRLGMTVAEADAVLAPLAGAGVRWSRGAISHYFDAALSFEIGDSGRIDFIGVAAQERLLCRYRGRDVFDMTAPELFAFIAERESQPHEYNPLEYCFPDQVISLWEADEQYDRKGNESRVVWGSVGVGSAEYLAAIQAINFRPARKY